MCIRDSSGWIGLYSDNELPRPCIGITHSGCEGCEWMYIRNDCIDQQYHRADSSGSDTRSCDMRTVQWNTDNRSSNGWSSAIHVLSGWIGLYSDNELPRPCIGITHSGCEGCEWMYIRNDCIDQQYH